MAATHVQSGSSGANGAAPAHTLAGAPTQGNLLVAGVSLGNTTTHTPANGYTKIDGPTTRIAYYWKIAGASEPAAQAPCTLGAARDWLCGVVEYAPGGATVTLDVSASTADATSPQDQAAIDPTDSIDTIMAGFASASSVAPTWSGQTIGGSAATERVDASEGGNAALTMFDRLNVNTSTSTFAAQATASATPTNGAIALLIFKLAGTTHAGAAVVAAAATVAAAGNLYKLGEAVVAAVSTVAASAVAIYGGAVAVVAQSVVSIVGGILHAGAALVAAVSSVLAVGSIKDVPGTVAVSEAVRGGLLVSAALLGAATVTEARQGSVAVIATPLEV